MCISGLTSCTHVEHMSVWELELQAVLGHFMGARNQTQILCKISLFSTSCHLSSPLQYIFLHKVTVFNAL